MTQMRIAALIALAMLWRPSDATGQQPPPIRPVGAIERISMDSLASVGTALSMPGGRVLINDRVGRRLVLFDSTLAHPKIVADTTATTASAYGARPGNLFRFRDDTALFVDISSLSMLVIGPTGEIARVMAIPRPDDAQSLLGIFGTPGFDARGRLLYFNGLGTLPGVMMLGRGMTVFESGKPSSMAQMIADRNPGILDQAPKYNDSAFVVRVDLETRAYDSVVAIRVPRRKRMLRVDAQGELQGIETTPDPLPVVDAWTTMADGSVAVVRGRDYHIDWLDATGHWTSSPKMPFEWKRVDDARKQMLIDSTVKEWQGTFDKIAASRSTGPTPSAGSAVGRGASGSGRGGGGGGGGGGGSATELAPNVAVAPALTDLFDYVPPLPERGNHIATADADGRLWILTSTMNKGQPVYDIVNRRGELVDRVQLPDFRALAGFGPGVVYMSVKDGAGVVHLERARIK